MDLQKLHGHLRDFLLGADPIRVAEVWADAKAQRDEYEILASSWDETQTAEEFATVLAMTSNATDLETDPELYDRSLATMQRFYAYYVN